MWSIVLAFIMRLIRRQSREGQSSAVAWELVPHNFQTGWFLPGPSETFDSSFPSIDESFVDEQVKGRGVTPREHADG